MRAFTRLLSLAEIDRPVAYAFAGKAWSFLSGPVTMLLITTSLTPEMQGYYYTFFSLLALQSFLELGFGIVLVQFASHEWAALSLTANREVRGDPEATRRLNDLGRLAVRWYSALAPLFFVGAGAIGYWFLSTRPLQDVPWRAPWLALVALSAFQLWVTPFFAILEGCNQVAGVNLFRFFQGVLQSLAMWAVFLLGGRLWTPAASYAVAALCSLVFLFGIYGRFVRPFFSGSGATTSRRHAELWPMQWRIGLSAMVHFFATSLYNPVMFYFRGAVAAGQMGMTLQMTGLLQGVALIWVQTKVPRYGMMISRRDYRGLDRFWFKTSLISMLVVCGGGAALLIAVVGLNSFGFGLAARLLPPLPTALFLLGTVFTQISQCETAYLRAHKREPLMVMSISSSLALGVLVPVLGRRWGSVGAAAANATVMLLVVAWETGIWVRCRRVWHAAA